MFIPVPAVLALHFRSYYKTECFLNVTQVSPKQQHTHHPSNMPADPCLVTVRAAPAASKGYENFVANKLKDEVLKEITSNLEDDLKEEALNAFKETVADGWSIKDCICKIQNAVLPKVPNERNKFFIQFTYDNQLQVGRKCNINMLLNLRIE